MSNTKRTSLLGLVILVYLLEHSAGVSQDEPSSCCHYGFEIAGRALSEDISCQADTRISSRFNQATMRLLCESFYKGCCEYTAQSSFCEMGKTFAIANQPCMEHPNYGGDKKKVCCDCCKSGRETATSGGECKTDTTTDTMCKESFMSCCEQLKAILPTASPVKERTCSDIKCDPKTTNCVDASDGPKCVCKDGYTEQGNDTHCKGSTVTKSTCDDIKCDSETTKSCVEVSEGPKCVCKDGYKEHGNNTYCLDIDECSTGQHKCPQYSSSDQRSIVYCLNVPGSYRCYRNCPSPYFQVLGEGICGDVNECETNTHKCGTTYHKCVNVVGSYKCERTSCYDGFKLVGQYCEDIDECALEPDRCGPHGNCRNSQGSYYCDCQVGFKGNSVTKKCEDEDECQVHKGNCQHQCVNTNGSYRCTCPDGYELRGKYCYDINECESSPCRSGEFCYNTYGTYDCINQSCPTPYYNQTEVHRGGPASCIKQYCKSGDKQCYDDPVESVKRVSYKFTKYLAKDRFRFTYTTGFNRNYFTVSSKIVQKQNHENIFRINHLSHNKLRVTNQKDVEGPKKVHFILQTDVVLMRTGQLRYRYEYHFFVYFGAYDF